MADSLPEVVGEQPEVANPAIVVVAKGSSPAKAGTLPAAVIPAVNTHAPNPEETPPPIPEHMPPLTKGPPNACLACITTKGRRDAFDEARERRRADADGRREKHAAEWAEATTELSAKLAELNEFAKGAPARWREAATTCLAEIHERQTKECEESLQKNYAAAWEEEQAAYRLAQELVQAGVDSTRAIGELSLIHI